MAIGENSLRSRKLSGYAEVQNKKAPQMQGFLDEFFLKKILSYSVKFR